jgi:hypothetical protein
VEKDEGESENTNMGKRVKCSVVGESIWNMARIMT